MTKSKIDPHPCLYCGVLTTNRKYCSQKCCLTHRNKTNHPKKGKHLSDEVKKNISEALKGKEFTEEHKKHISEGSKGKVLSDEHKKKIGESVSGKNNGMYGKKHTQESKDKMSATSKEYYSDYEFTEDDLYDGYRKDAILHYGYQCCVCGKCTGFLVVHHIDGNHTHDDVENLAVLCQSCHRKAHSYKNGKWSAEINMDFQQLILESRES